MKALRFVSVLCLLSTAAASAAPVITGDTSRVGSLDAVRESLERIDARCRTAAKPAACASEIAERIGAYLAAKKKQGAESAAHTEALLAAFEKEDALIGAQIRDAVESGTAPAQKQSAPVRRQARNLVASNSSTGTPAVGASFPLLLPMLATGCVVTVGGGGSGGGVASTTCTYSDADPNMDTQWKKNFRAGVYWGCNDYYFGYYYEPELFYSLDTSYFDYWNFWNDYTYVNSYSCFDAGYSDGWDDYILDGGYRFTCWDDVLFY